MIYEILQHTQVSGLCALINEKLKEGYQLQGGVAVCFSYNVEVFYQAIYKS